LLLAGVGGAVVFGVAYMTQQALDADGVRPDFGVLNVAANVVMGTGIALLVTSRRQTS